MQIAAAESALGGFEAPALAGAGNAGGITINEMQIVTPDVAGFREEMERESRWRNFADNGTPIGRGDSDFSQKKQGG